MKKTVFVIILSLNLIFLLCSCGKNDTPDSNTVYNNLKSYVSENGIENIMNDEYYIQISKTANAANTLIEASKYGNDCAFMEYDVTGSLKFFRNNTQTLISQQTLYSAVKTDAQWSDYEYDSLADKYRGILESLLKTDVEKDIEISSNDNSDLPYKVSVKYNPSELDAQTIFSNRGNFGVVSIKAVTDKNCENFSKITVSCQYDYDSVIYLYAVTFGTPSEPDSDGKNGQRPEDIEKIFKSYKEQIESQISTT